MGVRGDLSGEVCVGGARYVKVSKTQRLRH